MPPLFENQKSPKKINLDTYVDNIAVNLGWDKDKSDRFRTFIQEQAKPEGGRFVSIPADTLENILVSFNESEEGLSN